MRIILYRGNSRIETIKEQMIDKGYASGFEGLIDSINSLLPSNEVIQQALRKTVPMYPELAVRELVVNALIHQDFSLTGTADGSYSTIVWKSATWNTSRGNRTVSRFAPKSRNETAAS